MTDATRHPDTRSIPVRMAEVFHSIQGESTFAGRPCTFLRLAECNLRCTWCDSKFSFATLFTVTVGDLLGEVDRIGCPLVEITGGEPLLQRDAVEALSTALLDAGYEVLLETTLAMPLGGLDPRMVKVVDIKCPDSAMAGRMDFDELPNLAPDDEIKFVVASRGDFEWMLGVIRRYPELAGRTLLASPATGILEPHELAEWILAEAPLVRFQMQMHKLLSVEETADNRRAHLRRLEQRRPQLLAAAKRWAAANAPADQASLMAANDD